MDRNKKGNSRNATSGLPSLTTNRPIIRPETGEARKLCKASVRTQLPPSFSNLIKYIRELEVALVYSATGIGDIRISSRAGLVSIDCPKCEFGNPLRLSEAEQDVRVVDGEYLASIVDPYHRSV